MAFPCSAASRRPASTPVTTVSDILQAPVSVPQASAGANLSFGGDLPGLVERYLWAARPQIVGERGPIEGKARAATVTADTHLLALAISRDRLAEVMTANPAAASHMRGITAAMYG